MRKLVGLLYRQFYNNASSDAMIESYTAVIRLQLEYAAEVWDPHLQKNVELLHVENVQKGYWLQNWLRIAPKV